MWQCSCPCDLLWPWTCQVAEDYGGPRRGSKLLLKINAGLREFPSEVEISFVWLVAAYVAICWASQRFWTFFFGGQKWMDSGWIGEMQESSLEKVAHRCFGYGLRNGAQFRLEMIAEGSPVWQCMALKLKAPVPDVVAETSPKDTLVWQPSLQLQDWQVEILWNWVAFSNLKVI